MGKFWRQNFETKLIRQLVGKLQNRKRIVYKTLPMKYKKIKRAERKWAM